VLVSLFSSQHSTLNSRPRSIYLKKIYLFILFIVELYFISIVIISLHYYEFMTHKLKLRHISFEWMGKCFSVVRCQDSGTVRAGPNRIIEFP